MACWFGRCHIESRSSSSCCFNISNREISSGFRSRRRNSKITKRVHAVLKSSARSVTRISISPAKIDLSVLPLLGVSPIKGRFFQPEECTLGRDDVVIISARLWQRRFNSDPQIIGTKLLLNGKTFTVVGVMPASFDFPLQLFNLGNGGQFGVRAEIWKPLAFTDEQMKARYSRSFAVIGRLAPGTSV